MKRIPIPLTVLASCTLAACGGLPLPSPGEAEEAAAQTLAVMEQAVDDTATAAAAAATEVVPTLEPSPAATATPATPTATPTNEAIALTLAALATEQAPTLVAGQTLAAETQAALPTPTPLVFDLLSNTDEGTPAPTGTSLAEAWTEVYAAPEGFPFTLTTDEETLALTIESAMVAAGYGENVSDLNVRLNNSLVTLELAVTVANETKEGRIGFSVFAQDGEIVITLRSLQFDRFTVPPELLDALNIALAQALSGASDASQAGVTIDDVFIGDGELVISGTVGV